ncbi:MAG: 6,7-dimethyl-8-ribityllumazine synthase [Candidatus Lambdaproteobacteria bacterium RIFOXYD1_FULL_56_27]|uniref:6,7-dimethyl-8-ribityllumazine synthase n=1 Tax=Candidatus Lambdaproteobacteria bacterium RIFOXYD2_FULL_56_26 TaxID=1817773 RepID=A0A1F6GVP4_9PROT|nr:MAG: 6,7-dimethyl-8-ribityllumazine synthase [Candidatus Lambdaproteobacteria bacterium RIFOXYD2_FULL_56_26]OGH03740.1 MAG: 6,7-dimethyl-8-ribityllumazine synthase [Candidatus Lambdaproteobacteria bacterium RIFOXYC1_FULL_56_13]OGH07324.1 MAG: 6,7-dimethyl-8-ribityllumazine synthase [Candidatus Lambdaproteobacteria bacterium RIFOXYD1_FULL_56_27]
MGYVQLEGHFNAKGLKLAIVVARFNDFITGKLLEGALDTFSRHGGKLEDLTVIRVPGAYEIPLACKKAAATKKFEGILALGAVIRGSTPHFDYVASEVAKGVAQVSLETGVPVSFGVLTTDDIEQAIERAGTKSGNKGADSMNGLIELIDLYKKIS